MSFSFLLSGVLVDEGWSIVHYSHRDIGLSRVDDMEQSCQVWCAMLSTEIRGRRLERERERERGGGREGGREREREKERERGG